MIKNEGVEHIGDALRNNKVSASFLFIILISIFRPFIHKTLGILHLKYNGIESTGVQHLANALGINQV